MSKWTRHKAKWENCTECFLCETRKRTVLARGKLPCDVLFIGEAPGASEEALGKAFIGPAGKLLDDMIEDAGMDKMRLAWTNLIACFPRNLVGNKPMEPDKLSILTCAPRLDEFIAIANPELIVCVGSLAKKWVSTPISNSPIMRNIIHPAAILRMDVSQKGLAIQRTVVTLRDAAEEIVPF